MGKGVFIQALLLLITNIFGISLKLGLFLVNTDLHRFAGISSVIVSIIVVAIAFTTHKNTQVKSFAVAILLLTMIAAMGGSALKTSTNYDFSYAQMVISGLFALATSIVLYVRLKYGLKSFK